MIGHKCFMRLLRRNVNAAQFIRYFWRDRNATDGSTTAVSLHSHTLHSREGLDFIPRVLGKVRPAQVLLRILENRYRRRWGKDVPYDRLYWRPPLHPRAAHELEAGQIEKVLQLKPLVSITDHDNIEACSELRALNIDVPFSHEWTVPYETTVFHLGIHNLPADDARFLFNQMRAITANPAPQRLASMLQSLHAIPGVLVVLNHPLINEMRTGFRAHVRLLQRFLREFVRYMHALELNGLQPDSHNRRVARMAAELQLPVISGGDRHCVEPNANVNLTSAATFAEFVEEIRRERVSRVLFMPQYREATSCRYVEFISQAVRYYPEFAGRERWLDRVFRPTEEGDEPVSVEWPHGGPWMIRSAVSTIGFLASPHLRGTLRLALGAQTEAGA
jgi:hypothetical protein